MVRSPPPHASGKGEDPAVYRKITTHPATLSLSSGREVLGTARVPKLAPNLSRRASQPSADVARRIRIVGTAVRKAAEAELPMVSAAIRQKDAYPICSAAKASDAQIGSGLEHKWRSRSADLSERAPTPTFATAAAATATAVANPAVAGCRRKGKRPPARWSREAEDRRCAERSQRSEHRESPADDGDNRAGRSGRSRRDARANYALANAG